MLMIHRGTTSLAGAVMLLSVGAGCHCNGDTRDQPDASGASAPAQTPAGSATQASPAASKPAAGVPMGRRSHILGAGHISSCVIVAGDIHCWGLPLGPKDGGRITRLEPKGLQFEHVSRADLHVCARTSGGEVWCAGQNSHGELGAPSTEQCPFTRNRDGTVSYYPCSGSLARVLGLPPVKDVTVEYDRTCSITEEGDVFCWGAAKEGPGGLISPTKKQGLSNVVRLALGTRFSCALRRDGTVWCWGSNRDAQLGRGAADDGIHDEPKQVEGVSGAIEIGAGDYYACALSNAGTSQELRCWGVNGRGQFGSAAACADMTCPRPVRVELPSGVGDVRALAVGGSTTCALYDDRTLYCAGELASGIPGDGLRRVPGIPPLVAVANGGTHLVGISDRGAVLTWGRRTLLDDQGRKVPCAKCIEPLVQAPGLKVDVP